MAMLYRFMESLAKYKFKKELTEIKLKELKSLKNETYYDTFLNVYQFKKRENKIKEFENIIESYELEIQYLNREIEKCVVI